MPRPRWIRGLVAVAAVAAGLAFAAQARASTITVTTTTDTLVTDGSCSIREAIVNANDDAATWPDCAAGSGADTIVLPAGTITFAIPNPASAPCCLDSDQQAAKGDLDILTSMTIIGDPAGTVIDGADLDRIFDINPDVDGLPETVTPSITVQITDLTMTNARQNQSGSVRIQARATVTMDRCTVSNSISWADDGGGIFVFTGGALTLVNSTVSGNFALLHGGGVRNDGALTVISSTITNNDSSFDNLIHGLFCAGGTCTLRNTIVAGNGPAGVADTGGTIASLGYNIIGKTTDNTGNPVTSVTATTGDQFNMGAAAVDLQALADNGGPTPTHALGPASIAIDQGESSDAATDQRNEVRPCDLAAVSNAAGGDGADIGSFEVQGACVQPNSAPDAVDDAAMIEANSGTHTIAVLANDTDPDSDALTVTAVTQGAHGTVVHNGVSVSYTPNATFFGTDTFTYTVDDGHLHTDTAIVTVVVADTIAPIITPPPNQTAVQTLPGGAPVSYPAPAIVENGSGLASSSCLPASGSVFALGVTMVTCQAADLAGNASTATFTVTVTAAPDGRMYGAGHVDHGSQHHHFVFRVSQWRFHDYARLEYWAHDPRRCRGRDDDDYDRHRDYDGDDDRSYGRNHCSPTNRFESSRITSVIFSDDPGFTPGRPGGHRPTIDSVAIFGTGKWNGRSGYTFEARATDQGEPGRHRDTFSLVIKDSHGVIVGMVNGDLDGGNIQSTRLR